MSAFFSKTDTDTLQSEGDDRNNFVSLIVNNSGEYCAAITRKVTLERNIKEKGSFGIFGENKTNSIKEKSYKVNKEVILYNMFEISRPGMPTNGELDKRIEEIRKSKQKTVYYQPSHTNYYNNLYNHDEYNGYGGYNGYSGSNYYKRNTDSYAENAKSSYSKNRSVTDIHRTKVPESMNMFFDDSDSHKSDKYKSKKDSTISLGDNNTEFVSASPLLIKTLAAQLLTGSITAVYTGKPTLEDMAKSMVPIFEKRFVGADGDIDRFESFADNIVSYIIENSDVASYVTENPDVNSDGHLSEDEVAAIIARDLVFLLTELPDNKFINTYINSLSVYMEFADEI